MLPRFWIFYFILFSCLILLILRYATAYMALATFSYGLMVAGMKLRKNRKFHVILMHFAISIDLFIVLMLEFNRQALATVTEFKLTPLQQLHVLFSSLAVGLYLPVATLGWIRYCGKGHNSARKWHIQLGLSAFILRTLGFFFMFSLWSG